VDRDGDIDYVVGNLGLNTKYHASPSRPWIAYAGNVDGSGVFRFVEACYEGDILFPVRGKSCSTHALPSLAKKFTTFQAFARATLPQIYDPAHLKKSHRLEINELASGLLINNGTGRMRFQPLPRLAQVSAVFGMAFADVDADGYNDLCLAQNFFSPQPETGNVDGGLGLILRGHGNGNFTPLRVDESGVVIPEDAKALAVADLNGDSRPDLVTTVNNGPVRIFTNMVSGGSPFVVRLQGMKCIGSRVTVELIKGKPYTAEVYAGSGYLTGNSPNIFLGIPKGDSVKAIHIRLPDGTTKTYPSPKGPMVVLKL
ncbi:MAG: CRTAC1 family protein, partial [Opitutales bacterium]|nr:CRTAC1 family protein [Opitutales bacterium]